MLRPVTAAPSSKSSSRLSVDYFIFLVVWYYCDVWAAGCGQVSPSTARCFSAFHLRVPTVLLQAWTLLLAPTSLVWLGAEELGWMSLSRWGSRSSHECGPPAGYSSHLSSALSSFAQRRNFVVTGGWAWWGASSDPSPPGGWCHCDHWLP